LTPRWVIGTFFVIGVIFLPIGIGILVTSQGVVEQTVRYDYMRPASCNISEPDTCQHTVEIDIESDMTAPIFVYYKLTNFFQNHRRYVKSRSDPQLQGQGYLSSLSNCDPLEYGNGSKALYPCGLIANSFFNDTFNATVFPAATPGMGVLLSGQSWQGYGIAWSSDINEKFKPVNAPFDPSQVTRIGPGGFVLPDVTNEDFIVWMRTAGLPTFKKLYRKILDRNLYAGDRLIINVTNVFPVESFSGQKALVLSTTSWLGGKNDFLGWAYIVVAIICFVLGALFLAKHIISPRVLGDMKYFNFTTARAANS